MKKILLAVSLAALFVPDLFAQDPAPIPGFNATNIGSNRYLVNRLLSLSDTILYRGPNGDTAKAYWDTTGATRSYVIDGGTGAPQIIFGDNTLDSAMADSLINQLGRFGTTAEVTAAAVSDTANAVRSEIRDTVLLVSPVDQSIKGDDIDSTSENFVFNNAYKVTSATADSAYVTAAQVSDSADILRAEMVDTALAYGGSGTGLFDTTNANPDIAFWYDGTDTVMKITDDNDSTEVTPGNNDVLILGVPGRAEIDSFYTRKGWIGTKNDSAVTDSQLVTKNYVDNAAGGLIDQAVKGQHVDSVDEDFAFDGAYHVTTAVADSAYVTGKLVSDSVQAALAKIDDSVNVIDTLTLGSSTDYGYLTLSRTPAAGSDVQIVMKTTATTPEVAIGAAATNAGTELYVVGEARATKFEVAGAGSYIDVSSNNIRLTDPTTGTVSLATLNAKQSASLATGHIWVGNVGGTASAVAMSGDATINTAGAVAVADNSHAHNFENLTNWADSAAKFLRLKGGTMTGGIAMGQNDITNVEALSVDSITSVDFFGIGSEVYSSFLGWGLTLYYDHEATPWDSLGVDSSQVFSALFDRSKERVQLTGAHIHWVSEYYTNREVYGTFPWADTSTWATHLINIVDTAGDETATRIPFPTTWIVDVPCSVTTNLLVYQAATSYASMDSAGVDSAYLYVNGTKVDSASVDFSPGTTVGTDTLIMGAGRTLNVGDDVTVLWVLTTTPSATDPYVRIKNAAIERWRR